MSNKILILIVSFCSFLFACKEGAMGSKNKTSLGYSFDVHKSSGGVKAKAGDHVYFNVITMAGDSILEDTHIYPSHFMPTIKLEVKPPKQIESIMDALKEMAVGDSITLHIPIDSIPYAPAAFQSYKEIRHILTLVDIKNEEAAMKDQELRNNILKALSDSLIGLDSVTKVRLKSAVNDYNAKKLDNQLKTSEKGVKYLILKEGVGMIPKTGDLIEVNYTGCLTNHLIFDSSFPKGQPYVYKINTGSVIKGWDEALSLFKEGTEAILFIPSALGYGATGSSPSIPPNSELVFYVNLYKVRPI
ncbi:MAG: FKBP-type peptidyl-prolyl cis-trans isomerase [Saprospiraceae bacterium]